MLSSTQLCSPARIFRLGILSVFCSTVVIAAGGSAASDGIPAWQSGYGAPASEILAVASDVPKTEGSSSTILMEELLYDYEEDGRLTFRRRFLVRVESERGVRGWGSMRERWAPWHQERPSFRGRVIDSDGREHSLDPAAVVDAPVDGDGAQIYTDLRQQEAPLPRVAVGSLVEVETTIRDREPAFPGGQQRLKTSSRAVPVHRARVTIRLPEGLPFQYRTHGIELTPEELRSDGRRAFVFTYGDLEAHGNEEEGLPPEMGQGSYITFSTGDSWKTLAGAYGRVVDRRLAEVGVDDPLPSLDVSDLARPQAIALLAEEVARRTRYIGLELGEASLVPASPLVTLERGFGDCKDQATLLVATLRRHEISAWVALLATGPGLDVEPDLPGMGRFDHAIVYVPGEPDLWVDLTDRHTPFGELPTRDQDRLALIAQEGGMLLRTPASPSTANRIREIRRLEMAAFGAADLVETTEYEGWPARGMRANEVAATSEERRARFAEYVEGTLLGKLVSMEETPGTARSGPHRLTLEVEETRRAATDWTQAAVAIPHSTLFAFLPDWLASSDGRTLPAYQDRPLVSTLRYEISPPPSMVVRELPPDREIALGRGHYRRTSQLTKDGVIVVDLELDTGPRRMEPHEVDAFRTGLATIEKDASLAVWFEPLGQAELASGDVSTALAILRDAVAPEPDDPLLRLRLADAMLEVGLGTGAVEMARQAVEIEPESPLAAWRLGWILQHDEIGRRFGPGWDRTGARGALERALALDPDLNVARAELAILLEHGVDGDRYGIGAELEAAITEYEAYRAQSQLDELAPNLAAVYWYASRYEELDAFLHEEGHTVADADAYQVAIRGALEGPEAALRELHQLARTKEDRLELATVAGLRAMLGRRYEVAAALFQWTASRIDNAAGVMSLAAFLRDAEPYEDVEPPRDPAARVAFRSLLLTTEPEPGGKLESIFHPALLDSLLSWPELRRATWHPVAAALTEQLGMAVPLLPLVDLGLAGIEYELKADGAGGHRVRLEIDILGTRDAIDLFVVDEDGRHLVVADEATLGSLLAQAERYLDEGAHQAAVTWVDWARENMAPPPDDPFSGLALAAFWPVEEEPTSDDVRLAIAMASLAEPDRAASGIEILEAARSGTSDPKRQMILDWALLDLALGSGRGELASRMASRLLVDHPQSETLLSAKMSALQILGDPAELASWAAKRFSGGGEDDPWGHLASAEALILRGDLVGAGRHYERCLNDESVEAIALNNWAWNDLFLNPIPGEVVERARRAVELVGFASYASLHTLATAYAELDQPLEAYGVILQAIGGRGDDRLTASDRYVIARMAETYGFPDLARELYRKVLDDDPEPGEIVIPGFTTRDLAQRRFDSLTGRRAQEEEQELLQGS